MDGVTQTEPAVTTTTTTEPPLTNTPEARTETGELKDASLLTQAKPDPAAVKDPATPAAEVDYTALKLPGDAKFDPEVMKEASEVFKEAGLSAEQAQKLVDVYGKQLSAKVLDPANEYMATVQGWRGEVLSDTTLGDGEKLLPAVSATIGKAISAMGPKVAPEFLRIMDATAVGSHPAVVRGLLALGKLVSEGSAVIPQTPSKEGQRPPGAVTGAQSLYPNLPSANGPQRG